MLAETDAQRGKHILWVCNVIAGLNTGGRITRFAAVSLSDMVQISGILRDVKTNRRFLSRAEKARLKA